ncbi:hypothetical protein CTA2_2796 [Colletotrichum tanaceti]|uniref:Uncharacterized protein n=1 Tax=Colletotrichum tanaceti TaxID=1306861 RepID=A0A4U6XIB2_9PEZI|nr:hypothetical protein CTA2_2796 [Colletotrichum tanaceti]TKW53817.1 hypothetical protein CTA1_7366 [Colletotrichum tanaceti]
MADNTIEETPGTAGEIPEKAPKTTTAVLLEHVASKTIPTDPQTAKDFGFDRCITQKGQETLLQAIYAPLVKVHAVAPAQVEAWVAEGGARLAGQMRATFEAAGDEQGLRWLDYFAFVWNPDDVDAELGAASEEYLGSLAGPGSDEQFQARVETYLAAQARLRAKRDDLMARGEYVPRAHGPRMLVPTPGSNDPPPAAVSLFCPGADLAAMAREFEGMPGVNNIRKHNNNNNSDSINNKTSAHQTRHKMAKMDFHEAVLAHHEFLARMEKARELPQDLNTLKTWYFTRLGSQADQAALLGVYNTLVFDLGVGGGELQSWLSGLKLARKIEEALAANAARVPPERAAWFAAHRYIFRCDQYGHDTPVFRFDAYERRKKWPAEWKGLSRDEIELAIDGTQGGSQTVFEGPREKEAWLLEMARRWSTGRYPALG